MAPRQSGLTLTPVLPSGRCSTPTLSSQPAAELGPNASIGRTVLDSVRRSRAAAGFRPHRRRRRTDSGSNAPRISIRCGVPRWLARSARGWRGGDCAGRQRRGARGWRFARRRSTRRGPYILLGCGYASLAVGLLIVDAQRQRGWSTAATGGHVPLQYPPRAAHRSRVAPAVMSAVTSSQTCRRGRPMRTGGCGSAAGFALSQCAVARRVVAP